MYQRGDQYYKGIFKKTPQKITTVLDLPPELLMKVFENLSFVTVEKCRTTCRKFNEVGRHVMLLGMRKLVVRSEKVVKAYVSKDHRNRKKKTLNNKRLALGAKSLLTLNALIKTADAASFHLIGIGVLPPFPGVLLDYIKYAVTLATRRNPLIGVKRLQKIFSSLLESFTHGLRNYTYNSREAHPFLPDKPMFYTLIDLFNILPLTREEIQPTNYGMQILYRLPKTAFSFDTSFHYGQEIHENITMLMRLVIFNGRISDQFIDKTRQNDPNSPGAIDLDGALVFQVAFGKKRKAVGSLQELMADDLDILGFRVLLSTTDGTGHSDNRIVFLSSQFTHIEYQ